MSSPVAAAPWTSAPQASGFSPKTLAGRLLVVGLCAVVAEAAVYLLAVWTPLGQAYDDRVISGWRVSHPGAELEAARALTTVQLPWVGVGIALVFGIAVARRRLRLGLTVIAMLAGAIATAEVLKNLLLPRPFLGARDPVLGLNSFPSGHVTVAAAMAAALICVSPRRLRPAVTVLGLGYSVLIGTSALFLGWHRPSDIVGGTLTALVWVAFAGAILARTGSRDVAPSARGHDLAGLTRHLATASAVAVTAVALGYGLVRLHEASVGAVALTRGFWVGEAVIATAATLALVVLDRALRGAELS